MKLFLITPSLCLLLFSCSFIDEKKIEKTEAVPVYSFLERKEAPGAVMGTGTQSLTEDSLSISLGALESSSGETIKSSDIIVSESDEDEALGASDADVQALVDTLFESANK